MPKVMKTKARPVVAVVDTPNPTQPVQVIPTGSTLLDGVLGGGYPLGRIVNIVGDKSTGKTLLAMEAAANFHRLFDGEIVYNEAEAAFDEAYAVRLGMPATAVTIRTDCVTVEGFHQDLDAYIERVNKTGGHGLYILDSLDALSDEAELKRDFNANSYGQDKAKRMSKLFRMLSRRLGDSKICLIVISQVRDNINASFGDRLARSGGKALDFYSSIVLYLYHKKTLTKTVEGVTRSYGVRIRAKCKKNKIGLPHRECEFSILFGYGIDDLGACVDWIGEIGAFAELGVNKATMDVYLKNQFRVTTPRQEILSIQQRVAEFTASKWKAIDERFMVTQSKYGDG